MEVQTKWDSDLNFEFNSNGVKFFASSSLPKMHKVNPNPYEWFLFSLGSSTGLEILKHFQIHNTHFTSLVINVKGKLISKYSTKIFKNIDLEINCESESDPGRILNAVEFSQFLASGISAMISKTVPINWHLTVNNDIVGGGIAQFEEENENRL